MINLLSIFTKAEKAEQAFSAKHSLKLSREDAILLVEELERPAITNNRLKLAASIYELSKNHRRSDV